MLFVRALIAALVLAAAPAYAKAASDPGDKLLHDTVLSMPKLQAFDRAYKLLIAAAQSDPALKADSAAMSAEQDPTVADTIAKMDHHPRVYAFFQKQGLSKTEAALLPIALMNACMAVQYPAIAKQMADSIAPGQIDFCKTNAAGIKSLGFFQAH
jgi:hypothetical protein